MSDLKILELKKIEAKIQQEIYVYFNNKYCLKNHKTRCCIFSVPNESANVKETMHKISMGLRAGVSDLIIVIPNKVLFVEVKTLNGTQRNEQKDFENVVTDLGFDYILVRSLDEFIKKISLYLQFHT